MLELEDEESYPSLSPWRKKAEGLSDAAEENAQEEARGKKGSRGEKVAQADRRRPELPEEVVVETQRRSSIDAISKPKKKPVR